MFHKFGWWWYFGNSFWWSISDIFLNKLLGHYLIVINFFHYYTIIICQSKNSQTMKNNLEKYIAPFPKLIIINIPNCFFKNIIFRNTDELCRQYGVLKGFFNLRVSVHSHEISIHSSIISANNANVFIVKLLIFWFKNGIRLVVYTRPKYYISSCGQKLFDVQWVF